MESQHCFCGSHLVELCDVGKELVIGESGGGGNVIVCPSMLHHLIVQGLQVLPQGIAAAVLTHCASQVPPGNPQLAAQ